MLKLFSFRAVMLFFVVPVSLFVGVMMATAGTAFWPPVSAVATPLICSGEVEYESQYWSYRPGQQGVSRSIYCVEGQAREDITMGAIGMSFLVYSLIAFAVLGFVGLAMRGRFRRSDEAPDLLRGFGIGRSAGGSGSPVDVGSILALVSDAVEQGNARVVVRNVTVGDQEQPDPEDADPAARLAQLKALLDQGLIDTEDYEKKKAEILSDI